MTTASQTSSPANARALLLPYTLGLVIAMAIVQIVIAVTGGEVTLLAGILTAVVALGIVIWLWRNMRALKRVRFGIAIAHVIAFVTVTMSYNLHAVVHLMAASGTADTTAMENLHNALGGSWIGVTIIMSAFWGLGLLIHLVGAVLGRGWED